jgi:hypothetical protein
MGQLTRRVARQDAASAAFWSQIDAVARRALRGSAGRAPGYSASRVSHGGRSCGSKGERKFKISNFPSLSQSEK